MLKCLKVILVMTPVLPPPTPQEGHGFSRWQQSLPPMVNRNLGKHRAPGERRDGESGMSKIPTGDSENESLLEGSFCFSGVAHTSKSDKLLDP